MGRRPKWLKSKLMKKNWLARNAAILAHIPSTQPFTSTTLRSMLKRSSMVYIKPDIGTWGKGIMKVKRIHQKYVLYTQSQQLVFQTVNHLYAYIKRIIGPRKYLVQKGIDLLTYRGRKFDIRVMIQRNPLRQWEATGIIGRLAHPKRIVTNFHAGGKAMMIQHLLKNHMPTSQIIRLKRRLYRLGVLAAKQLSKRFNKLNAVGMDIAMDRTLYPYILEVNTRPDTEIFNAINNKQMYRKVIRYARAYRNA